VTHERHTVRTAGPGDNDALVALSVACPMEGDIGLAVDRAPDFYALNRLEGDDWEVGVVDGPGDRPIGCIAVARRLVHANGDPTPAAYVSDLKVRTEHRGRGVADALSAWARDRCVDVVGADGLVLLAVLAGNRAMQRRMAGPRGLPQTQSVATIRTHTVPLVHRRRLPETGVRTAPAREDDLDEMAELWVRWAPTRQFTPVHSPASLRAWIDAAPGLGLDSYRVARRPDGRLLGFLGIWDQSAFKRLRVTGYSRRLAAVRAIFNVAAPVVGGIPLPAVGGSLRNLSAVQVCVDEDDATVFRALLVEAYNGARRRGFSFLNVGLDRHDPLGAALRGLWAQPTDVVLCTASLPDRDPTFRPDGRAFAHEIALV